MEFPYKIIEGSMAERNEFAVTDGCQPTWAFFYIKKGRFRLCLDGEDTVVNAGETVILPDYLHFMRSVLEPIVFVYIKFCPVESCRYALSLPVGKVEPIDKVRFTSSVLAYEKLIDRNDLRSRSYREHLFSDILFQLYMEHNPQAGDDFYKDESLENCCDRLVLAAAEHIRTNIKDKLSLDDVCHALGTNPSTLNFRFRRELDCSVGEFIIFARMRRARRLLIGTNYTIGAIAARCGYENIYYFSRAFRKAVGCSPSEFRERAR